MLVLLGLVFATISKTQNVFVMYISEEPHLNDIHENVKLKYKKERGYDYSQETIYIYQTNSQYNDKSFQEIKDSYGLKWAQVQHYHSGHQMECFHNVCENVDKGTNVRDSYSCKSLRIYKTLVNNAPEISNVDECFDLMYESDFFMNVKKYTEGTYTKWHDVSYVLPYLLEYMNNIKVFEFV